MLDEMNREYIDMCATIVQCRRVMNGPSECADETELKPRSCCSWKLVSLLEEGEVLCLLLKQIQLLFHSKCK